MKLSLSPAALEEEEDDGWGSLHHNRRDYYGTTANLKQQQHAGLSYSDDDDDSFAEEEEDPHPLGFSTNLGRTRFALEANAESLEHYKRRWGYVHPYGDNKNENDDDDWLSRGAIKAAQQAYPPVSSFLDPQTAPTSALAKYSYQTTPSKQQRSSSVAVVAATPEDTMDRLASLLQAAASISDSPHNAAATALTTLHQHHFADYFSPAALQREQDQIQREMQLEKQRIDQENRAAAQALAKLLKYEEQKAAKILAQQKKEQQELQRQQDEQQAAAAEKKRQDDAARVAKEKERAAREAQEKLKKEEAAKAAAKEIEHVTRGKKLIAQLEQVRASVAPFEKSKMVGKRRLGMKKIVNGKVNTLSESVDKIRHVADEVTNAINTARAEDEQIKQQIQSGQNVPPELARGKRYLVDLLAAKVIVRVQAEGFNGQRGDGFPLANMLALVSENAKDLNPILEAHIYTVCPTAIPTLPSIAPGASEDELMESLGMLKLKDGTYESFERFLSRTEGIISLVADIMASQPSSHSLLNGHKGAIVWLSRFLKCLPEAPAPLPLLTAPVLDAFLTGAGHMLANIHPDHFKRYLGRIETDIVNRLDESAVGKPSSIRLKKTLEGGFEGFKTTLPSRALAELYYGANPASGAVVGGSASTTLSGATTVGGGSSAAPPNPFGAPSTTTTAAPPNPFGASSTSSSNQSAFGNQQAGSAMGSSPFGSTAGSSAGPFGTKQSSSTSAPSPFGNTATAPGAAPFGTSTGAPNQSPFGTTAPTPAAAPFGSPAAGPAASTTSPFAAQAAPMQPFGAAPTPFGGTATPANTPFGGTVAAPFGTSAAAPAPSPFGTTAAAPFGTASTTSNSPFGTSSTQAPNPFGGGGQNRSNAQSSPFGRQQPFGGGRQQQQQGFGNTGRGGGGGRGFGSRNTGGGRGRGNRAPCKYFAQGRCRYGDNCKFSHDTGGGGQQGGGGGFGGSNPFGGPRR